MRKRTLSIGLVLVVSSLANIALAAEKRVLMFNQQPTTAHTVKKNGTLIAAANSSQQGILAFQVDAAPGEMLTIATAGAAVPPSPPVALNATGDDVGCVHAGWAPNPEPDIVGYRIYWGSASVAAGHAAAYDDSLGVTSVSADVCALTEGTWYVAARAVNSLGLLSAPSSEISTFVSTGNAQPPLPPLFVQAVEESPGCILVSWAPSGDPTVTGYIVGYGTQSVSGGEAVEYEHSIQVGSVAQLQVCDLYSDTYYVAVRSRNHIWLNSGYSIEQTVEMTQTPVGISSFAVVQEGDAVVLRWDIWSDENLSGLEVYRATEGADVGRRLSAMLDPWTGRFVDTTVEPGTEYTYRLVVVSAAGERTSSMPVRIRTSDSWLTLEQNVPNPFNPTTSIVYAVPERMNIRLDVFDARGAHVATLVDRSVEAGRGSVWWDGRNKSGSPVASGTYFYRLQTPRGARTRKMLLIK